MENEDVSEKREILIVPTSHASEKSSRTVEEIIGSYRPNLVALELDRKRLARLKKNNTEGEQRDLKDMIKGSKGIGLKGRIVLVLFGLLQGDISEKLSIDLLGLDMFAGYEAAREYNIPLALVDQNIDETFKSFSSEVSFFESLRSVFYLLISYIYISRMSKEKVEKEIGTETNEIDVHEAIEAMEENFPTFKRILIDERNQHIAQKTIDASKELGDTVLVIGAAHEPGVKHILEKESEIRVLSIENYEVQKEI
jgi:pheromone shutdown protein TraB